MVNKEIGSRKPIVFRSALFTNKCFYSKSKTDSYKAKIKLVLFSIINCFQRGLLFLTEGFPIYIELGVKNCIKLAKIRFGSQPFLRSLYNL
jgi:hypothetical protein